MSMETNKPNNLKDTVLHKIESDHVVPTSKMVFMTRETLVWLLWLMSVLVGAIAVAVVLFVVSYRQYALYEATHENLFTYAIEFLPYLWVATFGLMAIVAVYNLRHTKRGYKYPMSQILLSSVVFSLAGGVTLHFFGFGNWVDNEMGEHLQMYQSQSLREELLWQQPAKGRMSGILTSSTTFTDVRGADWQVDTRDLPKRDEELLLSERPVRVLGTSTRDAFIICNVFPVMEPGISMRSEIKAERQEFQNKLQDLRAAMNDEGKKPVRVANEDEAPCRTLPIVKKMRNRE